MGWDHVDTEQSKKVIFLVSILSNILFFPADSEHICREHLEPPCVLHSLMLVLTETYCCHQGIYAASLMSPFCGGFTALLSNLLSADCHLAWSLSLSQMHEEWEGVWGPLCKTAVSVSGLGLGWDQWFFCLCYYYFFKQFPAPIGSFFPRECCVQCLYKLRELGCP